MGSQQPEMYNLRWNTYSSNLTKVFVDHHEHELLVDVTLSCEKHFIKAHRLLLSACSGYFAKIFESHTSPNFLILMSNVKFKYLKLIVQYMYQGEVKVSDDDIQEFLALGKVLEVKGLCSVELKDGDTGPKTATKRTNDGDVKKAIEWDPEKVLPFPVPHRTDADMHTPKKMKTSPISTPTPTLPVPPIAQPIKLRLDLLKMDSRLVPAGNQPKSVLKMNSVLKAAQKLKPTSSKKVKKVNNKSAKVLPVTEQPPQQEDLSKNKNVNNKSAKLLPVSEQPPQEEDPSKNASHIPRPPNAFMIFANQWRKKLAVEYPSDSNKDISVKLGAMWKGLDPENKEIFYQDAERASREHRLKYPGPKEARERKAIAKKHSENQTSSDVETLDDDDPVRLTIDEDPKDMVVEVDCDD